jgi:hypothetical protein
MKIAKAAIKKVLKSTLGPEGTLKLMRRYGDSKTLMQCWLSPRYWESVSRLRFFKNKHKGQRCFIIGNGPSLKEMDLAPLRNEFTFGLNRIYLLFESLGFATTYFVSVNKLVIEQCADEIVKLSCPKFVCWGTQSLIPVTSNMIFIRSRTSSRFRTDIPREGVSEGSTVTYVAMQLAYYMGFQQIILIGVDHSFTTKGPANELVTSQGDDPNHFHPEYFRKGFKWQLPDLESSEFAYKLARCQFELAGREILDATVGGKLKVFPKVDYNKIIEKT